MKLQIRTGVFETNSSSTHSLCICTKEMMERWENGEVLFDKYEDQFVEFEDATDEEKLEVQEYYNDIKQESWKEWEQLSSQEAQGFYYSYLREHYRRLITKEDFFDNEYYLEIYYEEFTTPSGDRMVAFGKYGYDG